MATIFITALSIIGFIALAELVARSNKKAGYDKEFEQMRWHLRSVDATREDF